MDRDRFARHLETALTRARDFARTMVVEDLPDPIRVRLFLEVHGVMEREDDWITFAQDVGRAPRELAIDEAIHELWRDGRVPQWIDVAAASDRDGTTIVAALACPRFVADEARLYHTWGDIPPFHVTSPPLPPRHVGGERFSVHRHSECVIDADVEHLARVADRVVFLTLHAETARSRTLPRLPTLPRVRHIEARGIEVLSSIASLGRHRSLAFLDLHVGGDAALDTRALPTTLETLSIETRHALRIDGPLPQLQRVQLHAARLDGELVLPRELESLSLHVRDIDALDEILSRVERLDSLDLGGTPVPDALARELAMRFRPRYFALGDTHVTADTLIALAKELPGMHLVPKRLR
ncbi:hypothetical protein [Sandaracinus amylolyticus]|uniref:hypothetical protein n=1 Tax=Sandaracinus amylolyticus TaxID=927083 RepID=UPI001F37C18A|nr:hypothetical protein [Sandaracinus amylolyticus]UJR82777.1 Hypothetical protein I5071_48420 [Sandaracinus amylolyticus]